MRRLIWMLAVALTCALPSRTLADSHHLSGYVQSSSSCGMRVHDDDTSAFRHLQCTTGVAVTVSWTGMRVRRAHGSVLRARFTDATIFATDSGEGVLDGLVAGDYVCLAYVSYSGTPTAVLVAFDPTTIPCHSGSHTRRSWSGDSDGAPASVLSQGFQG